MRYLKTYENKVSFDFQEDWEEEDLGNFQVGDKVVYRRPTLSLYQPYSGKFFWTDGNSLKFVSGVQTISEIGVIDNIPVCKIREWMSTYWYRQSAFDPYEKTLENIDFQEDWEDIQVSELYLIRLRSGKLYLNYGYGNLMTINKIHKDLDDVKILNKIISTDFGYSCISDTEHLKDNIENLLSRVTDLRVSFVNDTDIDTLVDKAISGEFNHYFSGLIKKSNESLKPFSFEEDWEETPKKKWIPIPDDIDLPIGTEVKIPKSAPYVDIFHHGIRSGLSNHSNHYGIITGKTGKYGLYEKEFKYYVKWKDREENQHLLFSINDMLYNINSVSESIDFQEDWEETEKHELSVGDIIQPIDKSRLVNYWDGRKFKSTVLSRGEKVVLKIQHSSDITSDMNQSIPKGSITYDGMMILIRNVSGVEHWPWFRMEDFEKVQNESTEPFNFQEDWVEEDPNDYLTYMPKVFKNFLIKNNCLDSFISNLTLYNEKHPDRGDEYSPEHFFQMMKNSYIESAFQWSETPEGSNFWRIIDGKWIWKKKNEGFDFDFQDDWSVEEEEPDTEYRIIIVKDKTLFGYHEPKKYLQFKSLKKNILGKTKETWRFIPNDNEIHHKMFCQDINNKRKYHSLELTPTKIWSADQSFSGDYYLHSELDDDRKLRKFIFKYPKIRIYLNEIEDKCQKIIENIDFQEDWEEDEGIGKNYRDIVSSDIFVGNTLTARDTFYMRYVSGGNTVETDRFFLIKDKDYKITSIYGGKYRIDSEYTNNHPMELATPDNVNKYFKIKR